MNNVYTFKGKVLILSFAFFALNYALTDTVHIFAMAKHNVALLDSHEAIPVVVLSNGENKKIMSVNEFFRSVSSNPNLTAEDVAKVVKLKNEIDLGKAQIDLFRKLTEKKEEKKDSFFMSRIKQGSNSVLNIIKAVTGPIISGVTTATIIGGVAVAIVWYLGWLPKSEFHATAANPHDFEPNPLNPSLYDVPKDYTYTDAFGKTISYEAQLCADNGWLKNLLRSSDCPPLK